jgi:DNA-binding CsgD family transcriptional regulator
MDSVQPACRPFASDASGCEGWQLVERALLILAAEAGMTAALKSRLLEVARGLSYRQMAELHGISINTIKSEIRTKLGLLGTTCCHEIRDASVAARAQAQAGAGEDDIRTFLSLRFE